jgi:hypothetical protein
MLRQLTSCDERPSLSDHNIAEQQKRVDALGLVGAVGIEPTTSPVCDVGGVLIVHIIDRNAKVMFVPLNYPRADNAALFALGLPSAPPVANSICLRLKSSPPSAPLIILAAEEPVAVDSGCAFGRAAP